MRAGKQSVQRCPLMEPSPFGDGSFLIFPLLNVTSAPCTETYITRRHRARGTLVNFLQVIHDVPKS
jgi:hypothetical protein